MGSLTPSQLRPASTNPSSSPESPALTSLRTNASPSQRSRIPGSLSRSALLDLEPPPARLSSLPSPSRSARNSLTDMPLMSRPMSLPPLLPTPLPLTMVNCLQFKQSLVLNDQGTKKITGNCHSWQFNSI